MIRILTTSSSTSCEWKNLIVAINISPMPPDVILKQEAISRPNWGGQPRRKTKLHCNQWWFGGWIKDRISHYIFSAQFSAAETDSEEMETLESSCSFMCSSILYQKNGKTVLYDEVQKMFWGRLQLAIWTWSDKGTTLIRITVVATRSSADMR